MTKISVLPSLQSCLRAVNEQNITIDNYSISSLLLHKRSIRALLQKEITQPYFCQAPKNTSFRCSSQWSSQGVGGGGGGGGG